MGSPEGPGGRRAPERPRESLRTISHKTVIPATSWRIAVIVQDYEYYGLEIELFTGCEGPRGQRERLVKVLTRSGRQQETRDVKALSRCL